MNSSSILKLIIQFIMFLVSITVFDKLFKVIKNKVDSFSEYTVRKYKLAGLISLILFVLAINFLSVKVGNFIDTLFPKHNIGKVFDETIMVGLLLGIFTNILKHKKDKKKFI